MNNVFDYSRRRFLPGSQRVLCFAQFFSDFLVLKIEFLPVNIRPDNLFLSA